MTPMQWLFHYRECERAAKREAERRDNIMDALEMFAIYSHPHTDLEKILSGIQKRKLNKTVNGIKDDIEAEVEKLIADIPRKIDIVEDKKEQKPILKTMKVPPKRRKKKDL